LIREDKNKSIKKMFILNQISQSIVKSFEQFFILNPPQNQRLDIMKVIDFDYSLCDTCLELRRTILATREFYVFLSDDYINAQDIIDRG